MDKKLTKQIVGLVKERLGNDYETADIHADEIDLAAYTVAQDLGIDEDDVRYAANLPR